MEKLKGALKYLLSLVKEIWYIPCVVLLVILVNLFICRVGVAVGDSMLPTLTNSTPILINLVDEIERKDIIIFRSDERNEYMVKRVFGLPGDTIQIKNNVIYVNNEPVTDSVTVIMEDYGIASNPITLEDDEYFVMGDNRNNSYDSRKFGPIKKSDILGIVDYSVLPFRKVN